MDKIGPHDAGYATVEATPSLADALKRLPYIERRPWSCASPSQ